MGNPNIFPSDTDRSSEQNKSSKTVEDLTT